MFDVGRFRAWSCSGLSRRSFLRCAASVPATIGLGSLNSSLQAADTGRAKSVILLWLWGAPSHIDTCDPKPEAPTEYRGPFASIATRTPGLTFTELLPMLADRSDRFSVIRSNVTFAPGHPDAGTLGLTGFPEAPPPVQPNFGSIVARHRGRHGTLPPFFSIGRGIPRDLPRRIEGYGGGTLGRLYDPFLVSCSAAGEVEIPALTLLDGLSPDRLTDREALLRNLDHSVRTLESAQQRSWDRTREAAYSLLARPESRQAFDLTAESAALRARYGYTTFGQSCLLARRLAEARVPYIQVNWSEYVEAMSPNCDFGWDTHIYNFELLQDRHCPIFDRAFSALLDDLHDRGLLEDTLVIAMGEFGRTPRISKRAARDHWPRCYFSIWAGAGVVPGRAIGRSDRRGEDPVTRPITPLMVGTTIAELTGVDAQRRAGFRVLDGGSVIHELF